MEETEYPEKTTNLSQVTRKNIHTAIFVNFEGISSKKDMYITVYITPGQYKKVYRLLSDGK
jgi:ssDNA-specific exonuclease RecJ